MSSQGSDVPTSLGGPTLRDLGDGAQNPDMVYKRQIEQTSWAVSGGPSNGPVENHPREKFTNSNHLENTETVRSGANNSSSLSNENIRHQNALSTIRSQLGLSPKAPIVDGYEVHHRLAWSSVRVIFREPFAEFFGTFVMILFGNGGVAQVVLSAALRTPGTTGYGAYQSINWGWALGVMLGTYVAGDSGGFLNPAITFCFCLYRKFPWRRFPIYFLAQLLGAFCASGVVYANYITAIDQVNGYAIRTVPPAKGATAGKWIIFPMD
jgi:aquaglyceroporin related protein, other eukaryote